MIFFFTGTGNTRYVATRLAEATGERLVSIAEAVVNGEYIFTLRLASAWVFVFPSMVGDRHSSSVISSSDCR